MKKMILIGISFILCLCFTGCGDKQKKYEEVMEEYVRDYYQNYHKVTGIDIPEITIANLENANKNGGANYDLSKLEDCNSTSLARLILKENSTEIDHIEFKMNCKK